MQVSSYLYIWFDRGKVKDHFSFYKYTQQIRNCFSLENPIIKYVGKVEKEIDILSIQICIIPVYKFYYGKNVCNHTISRDKFLDKIVKRNFFSLGKITVIFQ